MTEQEVLQHFFGSQMFTDWHWFRWHFEHQLRGESHPLSRDIARALSAIDEQIPGFAPKMADEMAALSGRQKFEPHYEQLLQRLAEIHVIHKLVACSWPEGTAFESEPVVKKGGKNPELSIKGGVHVGVEVKAPSLLEHMRLRSNNSSQIGARGVIGDPSKFSSGPGSTTLPRDNPIKDFLVSAEAKFEEMRSVDSNAKSVLVIIWDDFIFEPISALVHPSSGLLTEKSFYRDANDDPYRFPNVGAVVVVRHLHQFIRVSRSEPLADSCSWLFDYGKPGQFPFKVGIANPNGPGVPQDVLDCLQAKELDPRMGAEYQPTDIVWWLGDRQ